MTRMYAVIGGDQRQRELAKLLRQDGNKVLTWGFDCVEAEQAALKEAVAADTVVLPLPVSRDGVTLHLPLSEQTLQLSDLWPLLDSRRQIVCAGAPGNGVAAAAARQQVELVDYFDREETQIANAIPTVEGAIAEAMAATDRTIHRAKVLVIGYGRIGKLLAHRLQALGAEVTVSARRYHDFAWARAVDCTALHTQSLAGHLNRFDLIFNTVPTLILHRGLLEECMPSCVVIDLASDPGGVDFAAGEELGIRIIWARGLPGKVAPLTAAEAIRDAVYHILEERGEPF